MAILSSLSLGLFKKALLITLTLIYLIYLGIYFSISASRKLVRVINSYTLETLYV
jgi:hypothetical protein